MSQCNEEFIFTWTIENIFFWNEESFDLYSPEFITENFYESKWKIILIFRSEKNSLNFVSIKLQRMYSLQCVKNLTVNFTIEIFHEKDEVYAYKENKKVTFRNGSGHLIENFINFQDLQKKIEDSALNNLIVRCQMYMEKSDSESPSKRSCMCKTDISFDVFSFVWNICVYRYQDWSDERTLTIDNKRQLCINLRSSQEDFEFEIKPVCVVFSSFNVKCEIILLNDEGMETYSSCHFFTFENESSKLFIPSFLKRFFFDKEISTSFNIRLKLNFSISNGLSFHKNIVQEKDSCLSTSPKVYKSRLATNSLEDDLRAMLFEEEFADVNFRIKSEIISAHKFILVSRSPVFSAMFKQKMVENETGMIDITDMDFQTLRLFLEFLYTGEIQHLDSDRALDLLLAAEKYEVFSLKEKSLDYLKNNLSLANICDVVKVADMMGEENLKITAIDYIKKNPEQVLSSPKWPEFIDKNTKLSSEILYNLSKGFETFYKSCRK